MHFRVVSGVRSDYGPRLQDKQVSEAKRGHSAPIEGSGEQAEVVSLEEFRKKDP